MTMGNTEQAALADQLRSALGASGETLYSIAKRAGISYPVLYRFAQGQRGLNLESVELLAKALGLTFASTSKQTRSRSASAHGILGGALDQLVAQAISGREPTDAELDRLEKLLAAHRAKRKKRTNTPDSGSGGPERGGRKTP